VPAPTPGAAPRGPRPWLLPVLFAAFCALTVWCAVALLADRHGAPPAPARRAAPVAILPAG
jgi:hypothetical protein